MAQVRAREAGARRAGAVLVERPRIAGEARVAEVEAAGPGERGARPRRARRQDAVEHVDAALDDAEDALRVADPHEVARAVGRQERRRPADGVEHLRARLADGQAAERVAVEAERRDLLDRPPAELRVDPALGDAEEELPRRARGGEL